MSYPRSYPTGTGNNKLDENDWNAIKDFYDGFTTSGVFVPEKSFIVGKTAGGDYYANNAYQTIYGGSGNAGGVSGADAAAVIQAALNNGVSVFIKKLAAAYSIGTQLDAVANVKVFSDGAVLAKASDLILLQVKNVDGFEVSGVVFDGANENGNAIVYVENSDYTKVLNCTFQNPPNNAFMLTFQVVASYYCEVAWNYFDGGAVTGNDAFAGLPFKSIVHHNRVYDSPYSGITSGVVEDCVISDNVIIDPTSSGITIDSGTSPSYRNTIKGNVITGAANFGIYLYNSKANPIYDTVVEGNQIYNVGDSGILLGFGQRSTIANNVIHTCGDCGIGVRGHDYVNVTGNVVTNVNGTPNANYRDADGITFYSDPIAGVTQYGCVITGNTIQDLTAGPAMKAGITAHITSGSGLTISGGVIADNFIRDNFVNVACGIVNESFGTVSHDWSTYGIKIGNNINYASETSGTSSILNGTTSIAVAHGLDFTPTIDEITITLAEDPTNTPGAVWVDTIGAANFTVNCENDPGASNLDFGWRISRR